MADLEKTINPEVSNTDNSVQNATPEINLSNSLQEEPKLDDVTAKDTPPLETGPSVKPWMDNPETAIPSETSSNENLLTNTSLEETKTETNLNENLNSVPEVKTEETNNFILWKSSEKTINTGNEPNHLLEQPSLNNTTNLESPSLSSINAKEQQKAKLSQKEKLTQLIKIHESKAQKSWFIKWILSGIALTAVLVLASFILAKDQILNLLNDWDVNNQTLSASIVNLNENETNNEEDENLSSDENVSDIEEEIENNEDQVNDEDFSEDEWNLDEISESEFLYEEDFEWYQPIKFEDEEIENIELDNEINTNEATENEEIDNNGSTDEMDDNKVIENDEKNISEEKTNTDETVKNKETDNNDMNNNESDKNSNTNEKGKAYTITPVLSEELANWVMPAHCSDLTCYGEDKEFTPCTSFRLSENLDENTNRIGKNGVCRYKDASELVFVEFE